MNETSEFLTSNRLIRYPFADDSSLGLSDGLERKVFGCFVDAMVQLKDPKSELVPKVSGIGLVGHTLEFFLDCGDSVRISCTRSKTRFPVARGETPYCWYAFVLSSDGIRDLEETNDLEDVFEASVQLADRCVGRMPLGVTSIEVCGGLKTRDGVRLTQQEALVDAPDFTVSWTVGFSEGYNVRLLTEGQDVTLDMVPGEGLGTAPCPCPDSDTKDGTRGIWSVDGHVRLFNDLCYDFLHDSRLPEGQLLVQAKCKACCTCGMYADIVNNRLIPLRDEILGARKSLARTLSDYESAVARWNARIRTATDSDITLTLTAVPLESAGTDVRGTGVSGKMNRCGFTAVVRNESFIDVDIDILDCRVTGGSIHEITLNYVKDGNPVSHAGLGGLVLLQPGASLLITYYTVNDNYVSKDGGAKYYTSVRIEASDHATGKRITTKSRSASI